MERNFLKKTSSVFLSILLSIALMSSMTHVYAEGTATIATCEECITDEAYPNNYGRSDLRAYLNGLTKGDSDTLPEDSTKLFGKTTGCYPGFFSEGEKELLQPWTYKTNKFAIDGRSEGDYELTDYFVLPSGHQNTNKVLSWGKEDISSKENYESFNGYDSTTGTYTPNKHAIPISYWPKVLIGDASYSIWLRSPYSYSDNPDTYALVAVRGSLVYNSSV